VSGMLPLLGDVDKMIKQAQPTILGYPQPSCDPFTEMTRSLTVTEWLGFDWAAVR